MACTSVAISSGSMELGAGFHHARKSRMKAISSAFVAKPVKTAETTSAHGRRGIGVGKEAPAIGRWV